MRRNVSLYISLYVAFMIGYFLLLTVVLPSTVAYEPEWIKVGSFAEYSVEDGVMNGTYAWRIIAIRNLEGTTIVTINETFIGTTHWDHVARYSDRDPVGFYNIIPPSGRITEISAAGGTIGDLILWFRRYYNAMLR